MFEVAVEVSRYVPETILPVMGIASWSSVLLETISFSVNVLNVVAIVVFPKY
tara:strand:- start:64 stop:219 length:156 start_codon:yes stop_codon:yes gene_type:complete